MAVLIAAASLRAATLDNGTITVTANRTNPVQADQAVMLISLLAEPSASLADVLGRLKGLGLSAVNLTNVFAQNVVPSVGPATNYSQWTFTLTVGLASLKDVLGTLNQLQTGLGRLQGQQALTYNIAGTQYSAALLASQPCPLPTLVTDARKQADAMAAAAGMKTGAVVAVSDGTSVDGGAVGAPVAAALLGVPYLIYDPLTSYLPSTIVSTPQPSCSLTVQFKLVQ